MVKGVKVIVNAIKAMVKAINTMVKAIKVMVKAIKVMVKVVKVMLKIMVMVKVFKATTSNLTLTSGLCFVKALSLYFHFISVSIS